MKRFKATAAVGIEEPVQFIFKAETLEQARAMADEPPDSLRPTVGDAMLKARVIPGLRGWHNYEALNVEEVG